MKLSINNKYCLTIWNLDLSIINKHQFDFPMKIFTNLPGNLRALFGFLRLVTIVLGFFWLTSLILMFGIRILTHRDFGSSFSVTVGDVALKFDPTAVALKSDPSKRDTLILSSVRGTLQANLGSNDPALGSALRQTIIPSMVVIIVFAYVLLTSLRNLCANIEAGEVFCEENLRLVRRIGVSLIAYSLISVVVGLWASAVVGIYLREHVVLKSGLQLAQDFGMAQFNLSQNLISFHGGLVTGGLVLMMSEAFRQGLALKTESELTV